MLLCSFSRITAVGFSWGSWPPALDSINNIRYEFRLIQWVLNPIKAWLVASLMFGPLSQGTSSRQGHYYSSRDSQVGESDELIGTGKSFLSRIV